MSPFLKPFHGGAFSSLGESLLHLFADWTGSSWRVNWAKSALFLTLGAIGFIIFHNKICNCRTYKTPSYSGLGLFG